MIKDIIMKHNGRFVVRVLSGSCVLSSVCCYFQFQEKKNKHQSLVARFCLWDVFCLLFSLLSVQYAVILNENKTLGLALQPEEFHIAHTQVVSGYCHKFKSFKLLMVSVIHSCQVMMRLHQIRPT